MVNDSEIVAAPLLETRYETLIRVSQEIGLHRDPQALFAALVKELHRVLPFDYIAASVRDRDTETFHDHFIDMDSGSTVVPDGNVTPCERFTWWVYEHQQSLLTSTDDRAVLSHRAIPKRSVFPWSFQVCHKTGTLLQIRQCYAGSAI
jgi:hypothetical protein